MADLTRQEKVTRVLQSMKFLERNALMGIVVPITFPQHDGGMEIRVDLKYPLQSVSVMIPSPYDTITEVLNDPNYQYPRYEFTGKDREVVNGEPVGPQPLLRKFILDVTGFTEVPITEFEFTRGYQCSIVYHATPTTATYYDDIYHYNPFGYFLYDNDLHNNKCFISPDNVYTAMSVQVTLARFKEIVAIKRNFLATGNPCAGVNYGWKK
jgi:hypothetical protein